jgi:hypothetical protein
MINDRRSMSTEGLTLAIGICLRKTLASVTLQGEAKC